MYYIARNGVYDMILYRKGRRNRLWWIAFISFGAGGTVVKEAGVELMGSTRTGQLMATA